MRFRIGKDSEWYEFDGNRMLVKEARQMEELTGMGLREFGEGMQKGRVNAIVFMVFLAKRRAGEAVKWSDFDEVNLADLEMEDETSRAAKAEADGAAAEGAEAGPTRPANGKKQRSVPAAK